MLNKINALKGTYEHLQYLLENHPEEKTNIEYCKNTIKKLAKEIEESI
jgi:hypothetical protein